MDRTENELQTPSVEDIREAVFMRAFNICSINDLSWKVDQLAAALRDGDLDRTIQHSSGETRLFRELHVSMTPIQKAAVYYQGGILDHEQQIKDHAYATLQIEHANQKLTHKEIVLAAGFVMVLGIAPIVRSLQEISGFALRAALLLTELAGSGIAGALGHSGYFAAERGWFERKKLQLEGQWASLEILNGPFTIGVIKGIKHSS